MFCMQEHERQSYLLLPDELINVTRKFHNRSKYETFVNSKSASNRQQSENRSSSAASSIKTKMTFTSMSINQNESIEKNNKNIEASTKEAIDNLNGMIKFEHSNLNTSNKTANFLKLNDHYVKNYSETTILLENWRIQAEQAVSYLSNYFLLCMVI
jgi:hypothetical protein